MSWNTDEGICGGCNCLGWDVAFQFRFWARICTIRLPYRIDDIEDNSILRRGVPVAHNIFGVASTINSANYVYFLGLEKCLELGSPQAMVVFTEQCLELHRGQGMEIYWRDNYICPTEAEYSRMVKRSKQISLLIALSSSPYTCFTHSTLKFASRNWGSFWTSGEVNAALQWQQKVKLVDFCGLPVFLFW